MSDEKDVKAAMRDAYAYGTGFVLDGKHVPFEDVVMSSEEIAAEQAAKALPMTPDIRERAERLWQDVCDNVCFASPRGTPVDLISQALLEAHNAGREEGIEQAAREGYIAGAKTGNATLGRDIATAIRSIK